LEGAGAERWRGLVEKIADARPVILTGLRAGVGGVRAAEPAQAKAGGRRKPADTVPSRRRDLGVDVRAQRIFASLPGGRRKATVRRDLGVHLRARGKIKGRLLRIGRGQAR
jgi:hypothetical protein